MKKCILIIFALSMLGCAIHIQKPKNNETVILPSKTKVEVTGNGAYSGLEVKVDGVNFTNQMISTGPERHEGDFSLGPGLHTIHVAAEVSCWYCSGGKTMSTDQSSFVVANGATCVRIGGPPIITLSPNIISIGQKPGRQYIHYALQNGTDCLFIIVDDATKILPTQMIIELDIDPSNGVTWDKAIEAWDFCRAATRRGIVEASMLQNISVTRSCNVLTTANSYRSGCTKTQTMLIDQLTTSELWFRKPGFLGIWNDVEVIDASMWNAFGGRSVRFIWRID